MKLSLQLRPQMYRLMKLHPFLTIVACAIVMGCSSENDVDRATEERILVMGNGGEPKALDPQLVSAVGDSNIMRALFEGLIAYHPSDDSESAPGVAKTWESNEDFTEWTFHLRDDAKWSNGDPVTAHDFVYSYNRILSPALASPYSSMLFFLENAEEFNKEEITDFSEVGVKAKDDHTLVCTLKAPTAFFPQVVKHTTWLPVHKATVEKHGTMTDQFTAWQRPGNHVSNGAYKLKTWRINHSVEVEANPHYWDAETVKLKGIRFLPIVSEFTEQKMFQDGQLHGTYTVPSNMIEWYRKHFPQYLRIEPYAGAYFYRFNTKVEPLDNPKVRLALALAVDRKAIVENITMGGQIPAHGLVPPTKGGYVPPNVVAFDPERAKKLLAEAGFPNGKNFPKLSVIYNTLESHRSIAEAIQAMWKKHLGIKTIKLRNQEWKVFQQTVIDMKYDIGRAGWIGDFVDPTTFLDLMRTTDSNNNTGYSNPDYDKALAEAALEVDPAKRQELLYSAEEKMLTDLPVLPIYWYTRVYLLHPDVQNWNPLILDNHPYKHIDVQPSGLPFP